MGREVARIQATKEKAEPRVERTLLSAVFDFDFDFDFDFGRVGTGALARPSRRLLLAGVNRSTTNLSSCDFGWRIGSPLRFAPNQSVILSGVAASRSEAAAESKSLP